MAKILIVEDESIVAKNIQGRLKKLGYSVPGIASSGEEAIKKVEETQPDLVLMDIVIKGNMDGIEAARQIYNRFHIPVVYLTAYSDDKTLERAKMTEPFGYLLKPFEIRELRSAIEVALYKHKTEKELRGQRNRLVTTLKSIGDAVVVTDSGGIVSFMNPAAETLTGWKEKSAVGKGSAEVLNVVDKETHRRGKDFIAQALKGKGVMEMGNRASLVARDGTERPVDISVSPIRGDDGGVSGVVLVLRKAAGSGQKERAALSVRSPELRAANEKEDASVGLMIATSSSLVQEGIYKILEDERDIHVVALASDCRDIIPLVEQGEPGVLLIDTALPHLSIEETLEQIGRRYPDTNVLLLLHTLDESLVMDAISLGARGCLTGASSREHFIQSVRAVSKGEIWADVKTITKILTKLLPPRTDREPLKSGSGLTVKEEEVVKFIIQGLSNKQIAKKLYISEKTVKAHLRNMFKKFRVHNRLQLTHKLRN